MTKDEILKLAEMSRLKLSDEKAETFTKEIAAVLSYVGAIDEIVADAGVTKTVGAVHNVFRADEVTNETAVHAEALLQEMPEREGGHVES